MQATVEFTIQKKRRIGAFIDGEWVCQYSPLETLLNLFKNTHLPPGSYMGDPEEWHVYDMVNRFDAEILRMVEAPLDESVVYS